MTSSCPRCGRAIPDDEHPGEYPGATSRYDNETEICSRCGTLEAMWQFFGYGQGQPLPPPDVALNLDVPPLSSWEAEQARADAEKPQP